MLKFPRRTSVLLLSICLVYMTFVTVIQLTLHNLPEQRQQTRYISFVSDKTNETLQYVVDADAAHGYNDDSKKFDNIDHATFQKKIMQGKHRSSTSDLTIFKRNKIGSEESVLLRKLKANKLNHAETLQIKSSRTINEHNITTRNMKLQEGSKTSVQFRPLSDIFVCEAYLDQRLLPDIFVRILTLRPGRNETPSVVCRFPNTSGKGRVLSVEARPYEMCENHGKKYGGWIYSCLLPRVMFENLPAFVTIATVSDTGHNYDVINSLPLHSLSKNQLNNDSVIQNTSDFVTHVHKNISSKRSSNEAKHNQQLDKHGIGSAQIFRSNNYSTSTVKTSKLGVCVPPLFGDIDLQRIVNFLEMSRLLGASHVFLYIHDLHKDLVMFLVHYATHNTGYLSLVYWQLPPLTDRWNDETQTLANQILWNRGQLLAAQHCLYNNMPLFDWLLFMDTDEMLVPQKTATWPNLLDSIIKTIPDKVASISFESAFFQQDFQTLVTNSIDYFQYLHRTRDTSKKRAKLIVRPEVVFEIGIHHLRKLIRVDYRSISSPVSSALLHHYRKCIQTEGEGHLHCEILVKDASILKYEHELTLRSRTVINDAMMLFSNQS